MKKQTILLAFLALSYLSSCTVSRRSMKESNFQLWLNRDDIEYTEQLTAQATQTKILFIDWGRLFKRKWDYGNVGDLPADPFQATTAASTMVGGSLNGGTDIVHAISSVIGINITSRTEQMAVYKLIKDNPGYDVVMFPQFDVNRKWFGIGSKTQVTVRARLGKIKPSK